MQNFSIFERHAEENHLRYEKLPMVAAIAFWGNVRGMVEWRWAGAGKGAGDLRMPLLSLAWALLPGGH